MNLAIMSPAKLRLAGPIDFVLVNDVRNPPKSIDDMESVWVHAAGKKNPHLGLTCEIEPSH